MECRRCLLCVILIQRTIGPAFAGYSNPNLLQWCGSWQGRNATYSLLVTTDFMSHSLNVCWLVCCLNRTCKCTSRDLGLNRGREAELGDQRAEAEEEGAR